MSGFTETNSKDVKILERGTLWVNGWADYMGSQAIPTYLWRNFNSQNVTISPVRISWTHCEGLCMCDFVFVCVCVLLFCFGLFSVPMFSFYNIACLYSWVSAQLRQVSFVCQQNILRYFKCEYIEVIKLTSLCSCSTSPCFTQDLREKKSESVLESNKHPSKIERRLLLPSLCQEWC